MKVAERVDRILGTEVVDCQVDAATEGERARRAELDSWDEEGRVIVEQIITHFPRLFPYYFKH